MYIVILLLDKKKHLPFAIIHDNFEEIPHRPDK